MHSGCGVVQLAFVRLCACDEIFLNLTALGGGGIKTF